MFKFTAGWRNTSLPTGLPWRRFSGRLRPLLQSPSSAGRFPFRIVVEKISSTFHERCSFFCKTAAGVKSLRQPSKTTRSFNRDIHKKSLHREEWKGPFPVRVLLIPTGGTKPVLCLVFFTVSCSGHRKPLH